MPQAKKEIPAYKDVGWAWLIMLAAGINNIILIGSAFSFASFLPSFLDCFGASHFALSWIPSIILGIYLSIGPFASFLANKIGFRLCGMIGSVIGAIGLLLTSFATNLTTLLLCMGVLLGLGIGLGILSSMVMVGLYFDRRRAIATGFANCGGGAGVFLFSQLIPYLIDTYSWRGACVIMSAIMLQTTVLFATFTPIEAWNSPQSNEFDQAKPQSMHGKSTNEEAASAVNIYINSLHSICHIPNQPSTENQKSLHWLHTLFDISILQDSVVALFLLACLIGSFGYGPPFNFIIDRCLQLGFSEDTSKYFLSSMGLANCVSRMITGFVATIPCVDNISIFTVCLFGMGITNFLFPYCTATYSILLVSLGFGLFSGVYAMIPSVILCEFFESPVKLASAFGMYLFAISFGIISNPVAGAVFDAVKSYDAVYFVTGAVSFIGTLISVTMQIILHRKGLSSSEIVEDQFKPPKC